MAGAPRLQLGIGFDRDAVEIGQGREWPRRARGDARRLRRENPREPVSVDFKKIHWQARGHIFARWRARFHRP